MKKIFVLALSLLMTFSTFSLTAGAINKTVENVNDAMLLCREGDLCEVRKGTLYSDGKNAGKVYVIVIHGSNMSWDTQYLNCMENCILSAFNLNNPYLEYVKEKARKIPTGSNVMLIGHSLGGMIAQQFAGDVEMKALFNIISTLTMGSPYISVKKSEGELHRMADSGDAVPYLSPNIAENFYKGNYTYISNGYFGNPDGAHNISYAVEESWQKYDCMGIENGTSVVYFS